MLRKFMRGALYVAFAMVALWIIVNVIAMAKYALSWARRASPPSLRDGRRRRRIAASCDRP